MVKKNKLSPLTSALGATAFAASLAASPIAGAAENPFSMNDLGNGYQVAEKGKEGGCGGMKGKAKEGKCGDMAKKTKEGKCGDMKDKSGMKGKKDGQCGEGKCGGKK